VRSELARLVPGWGDSAPPDEHGPVEGWQRGRLFAALRDLLAELAAEGPCALVVEDVHWADATTLDFLAYLSAVDRDGVTPLVMTCREEEIGSARPVGAWLAELARRGVARLPLGRLSRDEVAEQIRGLLHAAVASSFVDEVFGRAGGNAFFTEQLVATGTRGDGGPRPGAALPAGLAQLLVAQADAVGDDARQVLAVLAIAGRGLAETLLASLTGLTGDRLAVAMRELADARLIDPPGVDGRYWLRHALVGEVVVADMLAGERRTWHAVLARALAATATVDGAGAVAEHWAAAGELSEEMPWRHAAAGEAEQVYAHREAATHWQRVIDLWPQVPPHVRPAGLDLATAYLNAIAALHNCGDTRAAAQLAEQALRKLAATADRRALALLYTRVADYREMDRDGAGLEPLEVAMQLLADLPAGREHAMVFYGYAEALMDAGRDDEVRRYLDRALQACQSGVPAVDEVAIRGELAFLAFDEGDVDAGMRWLDQAAALAGRADNHLGAMHVAAVRSEALLVLGRLEESAAVARAGLDIASRAGLEQHLLSQFLRCRLYDAFAELGHPDGAEAEIRSATESTPTSGASWDHMARASLDMLTGDLAAATARWVAVEAVTHRANLTWGGVLVHRGSIDLWAQRPMQALSRIQHVPPRLDTALYRNFTAAILTIAMRACADLAEAARTRRDTAGEQSARRSAQDLVRARHAMPRDPFGPHPYRTTNGAERASWTAELTRVAGTPDPDAWAAAATAWTTLGRPHQTAYARRRQAEALLLSGRTTQAGACLREAATLAHSHAPLLAEIRKLARVARLDLNDEQPQADRTHKPVPAPYGLTPREVTVLQLVADGLTNTQIGRRLFISESTASVHVTNILRKLSVTNRAQAAVLAQRAGLLAPDSPTGR
jgi:DNA-binding NarL/FixJ family response regulator